MNYPLFNWLLTLLKQMTLLLLEQGTLSMTDGIKLLFPQIKTSFNSVQGTLAFIDRFKISWFVNKIFLMSSIFIPTILPLLGPTGAFEERLLSDVEDVTEVVRFASRLFSSLQRGRRPSTLTSLSPPRPSFSFLAFSFTFSPFSLHTEEHLLHNTWSYHVFLLFL